MKMSGIVFSNIYDIALGELTEKRTVASLPFGGRYRQIDFTLSNMVNSQIKNIGVVTKYNYQSLMDHLGNCEEWDLNTKNSRLYIIPPFASGSSSVYRGKLEALHTALNFLKEQTSEYVVLSDTITICNINYREVLEDHIKSGKDVTAIVAQPKNYKDSHLLIVYKNKDNSAKKIIMERPPEKGSFCGMGMYIIDREKLIKYVEETVAEGFCYFERDFLQRYFNNNEITVNVYEFCGKVLRNRDISAFFKNNLMLLDKDIRDDLFKKNAPVYTKVRDEIPTYYGEDSDVNECIVADGCRIFGKVTDSVIFRNVSVAKNAVIKNSVIMQGTDIGEGAYLENVILDKDVTVSAGTKLIGTEDYPAIIKKGEKI